MKRRSRGFRGLRNLLSASTSEFLISTIESACLSLRSIWTYRSHHPDGCRRLHLPHLRYRRLSSRNEGLRKEYSYDQYHSVGPLSLISCETIGLWPIKFRLKNGKRLLLERIRRLGLTR